MPFHSLRASKFRRVLGPLVLALFFCAILACPLAAGPIEGGSFDGLAPEQQQLVRRWFTEYEKVTGRHIDPEETYDKLNQSIRTTFEAVTHALWKTPLTDNDGRSLGNALSIVKLVESVHGQISNTRGDQQFRVYVLLTDDALDKLYRSTQFRRTGDNTVYHIGYPINFRQQGGTPSIQVSVTRTGLRADIDVDYRSSSGPKALVNGHLTAANSDVRAGNNYVRHTNRWNVGLGTWWQSLFGAANIIPRADWQALSSQYYKPRVSSSRSVEEAVHDFYKTWFVDERPQESLSYMSVKANACIAEFGEGESARRGLLRLRLFEHMKAANRRVGKVHSLEDVLHGTVILGPSSVPMAHPEGKLFALSQLPDDAAWSLDCRKTQHMPLAADLPHGSHTLGNFYAASTLIRGNDTDGPGQLLYQIWTREEGSWKIVSWYLHDPFQQLAEPEIKSPEPVTAAAAAPTLENAELSRAVDTLLRRWLVTRDYALAEKSFAEEAGGCASMEGAAKSASPSPSTTSLQSWLEQVSKAIAAKPTLESAIQSVDYDPNHKQPVQHPHPQAYTLLRISDDLAGMANCKFRRSGKAVSQSASTGDPTYNLNEFQSIFEPRHQEGDRGAVVLTWARRNGRWAVVAFSVEHY